MVVHQPKGHDMAQREVQREAQALSPAGDGLTVDRTAVTSSPDRVCAPGFLFSGRVALAHDE